MALSQLRASVVKAAPLRQTIKHYACASMPIRELHAAIVRPPSSRMVDAISSSGTAQIDQAILKSQHAEYCDALTAAGLQLRWADQANMPDSVFVEDTAVASGNVAAVCISRPVSRRSEAASVIPVLVSCNRKVFVPSSGEASSAAEALQEQASASDIMHHLNQAAARNVFVDGGDVLQVGGEMYVGLSERSSPQGAAYLAAAFAGQPGVSQVAALPVAHLHQQQGSLHLKSLATCVGNDTLAVPDSEIGQQLLDTLLQFSQKYSAWESAVPGAELQRSHHTARGGALLHVLPIPASEWAASNAVLANGTLIVRSKEECPLAFALYEQYVATVGAARGVHQLLSVPASQVALVDGALTCSSIILHDDQQEGKA